MKLAASTVLRYDVTVTPYSERSQGSSMESIHADSYTVEDGFVHFTRVGRCVISINRDHVRAIKPIYPDQKGA